MSIKAIETVYKGYRFRSRTEARWAVFFDALDVRWEYECEGYDLGPLGWYLPDFWLPDQGWFAEVKPGVFSETETAKCCVLSHQSKHNVLLLDGAPDCRYYAFCEPARPHSPSDQKALILPVSLNRKPVFVCANGEGKIENPDFIKAVYAARLARFGAHE